MPLQRVSVVLVEPVSVFEFGVAVEVFGVDRTDDGVPRLDFRVCAPEPGRPLATQNTVSFTIVPTYGLDAVAGSDLVIVCPTRSETTRSTRRGARRAP